jgi:dUTP pyrophosphatase
MNVKFKLLPHFDGKYEWPHYETEGSAGMDIRAQFINDNTTHIVLQPQAIAMVNTGFAIAIPEGFEAQVRTRSGLALRKGLIVLNSPGTIDSDYRGEVGVIMYNASNSSKVITAGDRIAQLVFASVVQANLDNVPYLDYTYRGKQGFGSTGVE